MKLRRELLICFSELKEKPYLIASIPVPPCGSRPVSPRLHGRIENLALFLKFFIFCAGLARSATTATEGKIFLNITEMIEELIQPEGTKVLKIGTMVAPVGTSFRAEESSQPRELLEGFLLRLPNLVRYQHSTISL